MIKPVSEHGKFSISFQQYGTSVLGSPLFYVPAKIKTKLLVMAGMHGEETEGVFLLSRILRSLENAFDFVSVILTTNPDGAFLGTRGNKNGVDLNRNWPTKNWDSNPCLSRPFIEASAEIELSPGEFPNSEPETFYLKNLIENLSPELIISIHSPLACVDSKKKSTVVESLSNIFSVPWVKDIGYPTPGSFGTYCEEQEIPCITLELPRNAAEIIVRDTQQNFRDFLLSYK